MSTKTREEKGFLVDNVVHINSKLVNMQTKSLGKDNKVQYSSFTCNFLCQAWNCDGKSLREKIAEKRKDSTKEKIFCVRNFFKSITGRQD